MEITKELMKEYRTVQEGGLTNMFDVEAVLVISKVFNLSRLQEFIEKEGKKGYIKLLEAYDSSVEPNYEIVKQMSELREVIL